MGMIPLWLGYGLLATFFAVAVSGNVFNEKHILRKSSSCLVMLIGIFIIAMM